MSEPMNRLTLQQANPADAAELGALHARVFVATYPNEAAGVSVDWCQQHVAQDTTAAEGLVRYQRRIEHAQTNPDKLWLAARAGNVLVGSLEGYSASDTGHQELQLIAADPSGNGIGSALMGAFFTWIEARRFDSPVELDVAVYNPAISFFERYHFRKLPGHERLAYGMIPMMRMQRQFENEIKE
jgi:hypothetical protein